MRPRRATATPKVLADFSLEEHLCLVSAWEPPDASGRRWKGRWRSWREFLDDYRAVRAELVEQYGERHRAAPWEGGAPRPMFGDLVVRYREDHGDEALKSATYEDVRAY